MEAAKKPKIKKKKKKTATLDYQIYLVAVNIFWQSAQENTEQL